jgi:hypothetical protein
LLFMARNPRQAALYEVINRNRFRDAQQKALERIGVKPNVPPPTQVVIEQKVAEEPAKIEPVKIEPVQLEPVVTEVVEAVKEPVKTETITKPAKQEVVWTGRPRPVRIYPDRIELCFSWQIAGLSVLALAAIFLVFFRLGRMSASAKPEEKQQSVAIRTDDIKPTAPVVANTAPAAAETTTPKLIEPMGDNIIVIASYNLQSHLEPVKAYFAQYGIATEIIKSDQTRSYLLVTQNRYDSINKPGTDGYEMKKKIASIGANYKPPEGSGLEPFGPKPFQDVYGMKIK